MKHNSVERSIYYYDIIARKINDAKEACDCSNQSETFIKAFKVIKKYNNELENLEKLESNHKIEAFEAKKRRREILSKIEYVTDNGDIIYVIADEITKNIIKFRMILTKSNALPYIEKSGKLSFMASEVKGEFNLAEVTHCVIFPSENILGAEFNFSGARPSAISFYLPHVTKAMQYIDCHGKLNKDTFSKLVNNKGYSLFSIGVRNTEDMRIQLRDNMGLIGSFFENINDVDLYEVIIKRKKSKNNKGFTPPLTINQMEKFVRNNRDNIKTFKVSQEGIRKDCIDLLSDKLVSKRKFIKTRYRTIDSNEMYEAIISFFQANINDK